MNGRWLAATKPRCVCQTIRGCWWYVVDLWSTKLGHMSPPDMLPQQTKHPLHNPALPDPEELFVLWVLCLSLSNKWLFNCKTSGHIYRHLPGAVQDRSKFPRVCFRLWNLWNSLPPAVASICSEDYGAKLLFSTLLFSFVCPPLPFPSRPLRNRAP